MTGKRAADATELLSDVEFMSMRLSQLINANDNMVIRYAVEMDSTSNDRKHEYQKKLDQLLLIYAISPDTMIDRSQSVEAVVFYQTTDAGITIRNYKKTMRSARISWGSCRSWTKTEISSPIPARARRSAEAALIFAFASYFASYFLRQIVNPIGELSEGLKQIEDGKMDIHITPQGQAEVRGKKLVVGLFFLGMLTPSFVTEISRFRIINGLHLYNTLAAPIVIMIPTVLTYVFFQKYILAGIAAGAVKE